MKLDKNKKPYIVFDTNVLISAAILPNSPSRKALTFASKNFQIVISDAILDELKDVIERPHLAKYFSSVNSRFAFLFLISRVTENFQPHSVITDCRDPDDNHILELAVDVGAKIIVCGDKDLLVLNPYREIAIIRAGDFLETLA
jgi:uncharacterized protein